MTSHEPALADGICPSSLVDRAVLAVRETSPSAPVPPDLVAAVANFDTPAGFSVPQPAAEPAPRPSLLRLLLIALSVAVLVAAGAFMISPLDRQSVAFADVAYQIRKIKAVRCTIRVAGLRDDVPEQAGVHYESDTGICRTEYPDAVLLTDPKAGRLLMLRPQEQVAVESPLRPDPDHPAASGLIEAFRQEIGKARAAGRERIDGIDTQVFELTRGSSLETYWVDPTTRLPVRVEARTQVMGRDTTWTMDRFEWGVSLDPDLLSFGVPAGYRSTVFDPGEPMRFDDHGNPLIDQPRGGRPVDK